MTSPKALTPRQRFWERLFASSVLLYTFASTYVVWKTLTKYGAHWWIFFLIDLPTSWFYGIATSRVVIGIARKRIRESTKWGWIAAINFAIPQIYILYYAHHASKKALLIFAFAITTLALFSLYSLVTQIRKSRKSG